MPVESTVIAARSLSVKQRLIPSPLVSQLDCSEVHDIGPVTPDLEEKIFKLGLVDRSMKGPYATKMSGNWIFIGSNPNDPMIGDVRVQYRYCPLGIVSVMAKQGRNSLDSFTTSSNTSVFMITRGDRTAAEMCSSAEQSNSILTWVLRAVGFFLCLVSINLMLAPVSEVLRFLPFLTSIVGIITSVGAFFVASVFSLLVIALAWVFYRPLLAFALLGLAALLFAYRMGYLGLPQVADPASGTP